MITHEHVVEMMKAAIRATQDLPMFVSVCVLCVCVSDEDLTVLVTMIIIIIIALLKCA